MFSGNLALDCLWKITSDQYLLQKDLKTSKEIGEEL
jgi:hypothetical protein